MDITLNEDPTHGTWSGGTVVYRVTVDDTWIGWVGDGRKWKGSHYGPVRWWACWRQDGDTAARWCSDLDYRSRNAARLALLVRITAHHLD
ncbi:hypothetical protein [Lentzea sp. NPDC051838]|uniref:hypothetical protein n=1 Tax=Lentzea sp. NPDC051838 TaxID=3154849 RepID=UPI003419B3E5